jgi:hypothetical protein
MISYQTFRERLGELKLPPPANITLWRVLDEWCDAQGYTGHDGLTLVDEMLDGFAKKVWRGLEEVVEIERASAKRKAPRG